MREPQTVPRQLYVARQPIFDRHLDVFAYELLFRGGPQNFFNAQDVDGASLQVIHDSMTTFGLDRLVGNRRAFVNVTRAVLVDELYALLPPGRVVVELLETVLADEQVLEACRVMRRAGYLIALDDFVLNDESAPLLQFADVVKIDFLATGPAERERLKQALGGRRVRLLAEKVETETDFHQAMALGCEYFQGYFFSRPEMVSESALSPLQTSYLRFLRELSSETLDYDTIEDVIKREVALTTRLLRLLNSAAFGWRRQITSIKHALQLLGERTLRKWAYAVTVMEMGHDQPRELIRICLQRARMCELAAGVTRLDGHDFELFLVGLLSATDAILRRPLDEVLAQMACPAGVAEALHGGAGPLGQVLRLVLAYEGGRWDEVAAGERELRLPSGRLPGLFEEAAAWAEQAVG